MSSRVRPWTTAHAHPRHRDTLRLLAETLVMLAVLVVIVVAMSLDYRA